MVDILKNITTVHSGQPREILGARAIQCREVSLIHESTLSETREHGPKAVQTDFDIFDHRFGEILRFRQATEIGEALVSQPENVEARFIPGDQLVAGFDCLSWLRHSQRCRRVAAIT